MKYVKDKFVRALKLYPLDIIGLPTHFNKA